MILQPRLLGWHKSPADNRDYRLIDYRAGKISTRKRRIWPCDIVLDQSEGMPEDKTGHCVGFSGADFGNSYPICDGYSNADGHRFYYMSKEVDGEPNQENGSTIRSIAKVLKQLGRIDAYAFADDWETISYWLLEKSPMIFGTLWTEGMFTPDQFGYIHPSGQVVGGHAWVGLGCFINKPPISDTIIGLNSWGPEWASKGQFRMRVNEFMPLYQQGGESVTAVELPIVTLSRGD